MKKVLVRQKIKKKMQKMFQCVREMVLVHMNNCAFACKTKTKKKPIIPKRVC
jgi:hypothetical protein